MTHIGIDGCIWRARECMYWPRMSTELREFISKCEVCLAHRPEQTKEPLEQHQFAVRPWNKIGANLCELNGRTPLAVSDYYSNFIEVEKLNNTTSSRVIKALKAITKNGIRLCTLTAIYIPFSRILEVDMSH